MRPDEDALASAEQWAACDFRKADGETIQSLVDEIRYLRRVAMRALDGWEGLWTSDNNDTPPPEIDELRKQVNP